MEFALMTEPQLGGTYEELLAAARIAEEFGLVSFARSDHYYWSREGAPAATDAFATMGGLARETNSIRLCVLVTPITFRHPAVIAKSAATIDEMSGGRFDLGVGTGWMDLEHEAFGLPFPDWSERFARLEEALQYLSAAFSEGAASFEGEYYSLDADVIPKPSSGLSVVVGGSGAKRTPAIAGTYADEYNHFVRAPEVVGPKIARARAAATEAGRDPEALRISVMGGVLVGRDEDDYRAKLASRAASRGLGPDELEERMADTGMPAGPAGKVTTQLAELEAVGVTRYYVQHLDLSDLDPVKEALELLLSA